MTHLRHIFRALCRVPSWWGALMALACPALLACDEQGVSLGTEELCVADPDLLEAQADSAERVSTCARIGENQLIDAGFEVPVIDCAPLAFCEVPAADVEAWHTSSDGPVIEIWHDGYNGVPAFAGSQFVELNATSRDTLWQDVDLPPGQLMYWSFQHHGRNGVDDVELQIGAPDDTTSQGVFSSGIDSWHQYRGLYRVGPQEVVTRFVLASRSGVSEGNLIDDVIFAPVD